VSQWDEFYKNCEELESEFVGWIHISL